MLRELRECLIEFEKVTKVALNGAYTIKDVGATNYNVNRVHDDLYNIFKKEGIEFDFDTRERLYNRFYDIGYLDFLDVVDNYYCELEPINKEDFYIITKDYNNIINRLLTNKIDNQNEFLYILSGGYDGLFKLYKAIKRDRLTDDDVLNFVFDNEIEIEESDDYDDDYDDYDDEITELENDENVEEIIRCFNCIIEDIENFNDMYKEKFENRILKCYEYLNDFKLKQDKNFISFLNGLNKDNFKEYIETHKKIEELEQTKEDLYLSIIL